MTGLLADLPNPGQVVTDLLGDATGWGFAQVADGISKWILGAVAFFVDGAIGFLRNSARPDVGAAWFAGSGSPYASVRSLAAVLLVGFVLLGLLQGLLAGDPGGMVRRVAGGLPAAVGGIVVTTAVVGYLLQLTDALSEAVLAGTDDKALHFLSGFGATASGATGGFAAVVIGLVAVAAGLLLWIELVVRSSLVYILVAVSPLAFAASLWPAARSFLRRLLELLLAVVLSKLVISIALAVGVSALSGAGSAGTSGSVPADAGSSVGALLTGAVVLGLAAFSPFVILKLAPAAEAAVVAQGVSRGPLRATQTGAYTAQSASNLARISGNHSSSGSTAAAGPGPVDGAGAASGGGGGGAAGGGASSAVASGGGVAAGGTTVAGAGAAPAAGGPAAAGAGAGAAAAGGAAAAAGPAAVVAVPVIAGKAAADAARRTARSTAEGLSGGDGQPDERGGR